MIILLKFLLCLVFFINWILKLTALENLSLPIELPHTWCWFSLLMRILMLPGLYYWGCQLHSAENGSKSGQHDFLFHQIPCSTWVYFGELLEAVWSKVTRTSAAYLEARLDWKEEVKRVDVLWPQDTLTTVQHYRNVPLENRPWLFHTQKFFVLDTFTLWLILCKCTLKFNAWPSTYLEIHTSSVHVDGWMDG